jgi:hypothetical protein
MSGAVAEHLGMCAACSQELAEWRSLGDAMRIREQQVPPDRQALESWIRLEAELPVISLETSHAPRRRSLSTRYRLIPVIAALLLIALGSAVFGVMMQGRISHLPKATQPSACIPNRIGPSIPRSTELRNLAMTSPDSGWAVGVNVSDNSPVILQYHDCEWTADPVSLPSRAELFNISALSPTDAWALAFSHSGTYIFLHYTGGRWQQTTAPFALNSVQGPIDGGGFTMVSDSEGWLNVTPQCYPCGQINDGSPEFLLYHGVSGVYSPVNAPAGYRNLWLVRAFANGVAWIRAESSNSKEETLMLYHNGVLSPRYVLPAQATIDEPLQVQMDTPEDAWITMGHNVSLLLLHCSLSSCKLTPLPGDPIAQTHSHVDYPSALDSATVGVFSADAGWAFLSKWETPPVPLTRGVVWTPTQVTTVYQLQNGRWHPFSWPFHVGMVYDIVQVAPNEYWAFTPTSLLHFVNGSWSLYS